MPIGPKFPNRAAYELLAVGFCKFKGNADPGKVIRSDVGIPVHLVAAHKEVAVFENNPKRCGRKPDPALEDADKLMTGSLAHGFSVSGSGVRLTDTFRGRVHARMTPGVVGIVDMLTWFWIHAPSGHPPELHPS